MSYQIPRFQTYPNIFQNYQLTVWMCCLLVLAKLTIPEHSDTYYSKKHDLNLMHEIFSFENNQQFFLVNLTIYNLHLMNIKSCDSYLWARLVYYTHARTMHVYHMHVYYIQK